MASSANQIDNSGTDALNRIRGTHGVRNQNEIISAGGSGKYLNLITWPDRPFRHGAGLSHSGEIHRHGEDSEDCSVSGDRNRICCHCRSWHDSGRRATRCDVTFTAWKAAGVKLPHSASKQYRIGKKISKSQLGPGDTVFFYPGIKHVALYAGNGNVIHASHPGKKVSYIKMKYMPYVGARRPG
jgi:hypothetical protein